MYERSKRTIHFSILNTIFLILIDLNQRSLNSVPGNLLRCYTHEFLSKF